MLVEINNRKMQFSEIFEGLLKPIISKFGYSSRGKNFIKKRNNFTTCLLVTNSNNQYDEIIINYSFYIPRLEEQFYELDIIPYPKVSDCHSIGTIADVVRANLSINDGACYFLNPYYYMDKLEFLTSYRDKWQSVYNTDKSPLLVIRDQEISFLKRYSVEDINSLKEILKSDFESLLMPYLESIIDIQSLISAFKDIAYGAGSALFEALLTHSYLDKNKGLELIEKLFDKRNSDYEVEQLSKYLNRYKQ